MAIIGLGVDYSNISKDYNTSYLDRDNKDPKTMRCMKSVVAWVSELLEALESEFSLNTHYLSDNAKVSIDTIAANRFLFYSLEKEITLQSFVLRNEFNAFEGLAAWEANAENSILVQNDEDGEGIYFFMTKDSSLHTWMQERLSNFSVDDVEFKAK